VTLKHEELWRPRYDAAAEIAKMKPWTWMEESDIFGLQMPGTSHVCYVSVMGLLGEHLAVSVYLEEVSADGFHRTRRNIHFTQLVHVIE